MNKLASILAVVDAADEKRSVVTKAMVLARHFGARVELFFCDAEQAYALSHAYDPAGRAAARQSSVDSGLLYLEAIRRALAEDVRISIHAVCESPLYEAIVRRVAQIHPDLVIKSAAGNHPQRHASLDANDWQLARTCPVPLMLTRGRPWSAQPRFGAAGDVLTAADFFTQGCGAELDVVNSDAEPGHAPGFDCDLLVLGSLNSGLVEALDCDVVLVKPEVQVPTTIPGTPIFTGEESERGYALNRMCYSFNDEIARLKFLEDEDAYCKRFGLDEQQRDAVRRRDVLAMISAGGNIYYLAKLAGIFGLSVQDIGAQQTGVTVQAFRERLAAAGR